jgi:hypothetical protein
MHQTITKMKRFLIAIAFALFVLSSCETGYGKYGRCQANTKSGSQCKSNAGKTGYCGSHK